MRLPEIAAPVFAKHETFHPRYGWFRKAHNCVEDDSLVFSREDAPVQIGVGKNMVRAIRFWGLASKIIEEDSEVHNRRSAELVTTSMGDKLFGESGWDQYMEDPGTLWLLHWLMLAPMTRLPVWWLAYNEFSAVVFTESELERVITEQLEINRGWGNPSTSSIAKDVKVLLRTYAPTELTKKTKLEDTLDCPLRELNLIQSTENPNQYRFSLGPKPELPTEILGFTLLDYCKHLSLEGSIVPLSRLSTEPGSPGKVFKLTEADIFENIEIISSYSEDLEITISLGVPHISWSSELSKIADDFLSSYYRKQ